MPRLQLTRVLCHLFVYDFPHDFSGIVGGGKLRRMCLHCLQSLCDFFPRQTGQNLTETLRISKGNRTVIVKSSCNLNDIHTKIARCTCDVIAGSLQLSQDPTIIFGPRWLSKSCVFLRIRVRCLYVDRVIYWLRCVYRLAIFQNLSLCRVKQNYRGYDAPESVG